MEQHPVPQNITSFEFRLIGDMTIRQFGLLAGGAILAWIFWQLPIPGFIRIPLASLFAFAGLAFAFLPFDNRPLHRWLIAFIKATYSPTQFVFQKSEEAPLYLTAGFPAAAQKIVPFQVAESRHKLEEYLKTLPRNLPTALETKEMDSLKKVQGLLGTISALPTPHLPSPPHLHVTPPPAKVQTPTATPKITLRQAPQPPPQASSRRLTFTEGGRLIFEEEKKTVPTIPFSPGKISNRSELLVEEIKRLKEAISNLKRGQPSSQAPSSEIINYEEQLNLLAQQLEKAEEEKEGLMKAMFEMQKEMSQKPKGVIPTETLEKPQDVKIISAESAKKVGLPTLTSTPNVITGVVQDQNGSFLPNILVEVKDEQGNSVRAFKTNKLGQFIAITPLANGTYTIELEDPRHEFNFDIIEVEAKESVIPALAITAKSQQTEDKEKIRQALFGGN